jgi:N-acetylglucosamine-6-phosphate deacetylase
MTYTGIDCFSGKPVSIRAEGASIVSAAAAAGEGGLPFIAPGFFDLQLNGYAGVDYSDPGLEGRGVEAVVKAIAKSGTTRHLATIITAPRETISRNCAVIAAAAGSSALARAGLAGIHVEGPFISPEDGARGAHDPKHLRKPDFEEFLEWQDRAEGLVRVVTVAPELEGCLGFIEKISERGVVASIGHTSATPKQIREAVLAGARLSTHLGNGSHGLLPRTRNYLWEQLASDELAASIIADGFHLPDSALRVFGRAKPEGRLILISDANHLAGGSPGLKSWGDTKVEVHPDGHISLAGTEFLAGAGHLLDRGIAQYLRAGGLGLGEAVAACTRNPLRLLGLGEAWGRLEPGSPAHLVLFRLRPGAEALEVEACVVGGEELYRRGA